MEHGNEVVFVSYRRADSGLSAAWLARQLADSFGHGSVYLDVDSTQAGSTFPDELRFALERSLVLLAVVGPGWAAELKLRATRAGEADYVAEELRIARRLGIPILPVLVDGARMPSAGELPADLAFLADTQALDLPTPADAGEFDTIANAVARIGGLPRARRGHLAARLRDGLRTSLRSPLELALRPRRFLLRSLRGRESDLLVLVGWSWVALAVTLPLYTNGFGLTLGSLSVGTVGQMLVAMPLFLLVTTLPLAGLSALALRLLRGRGSFMRMFSLTCMLRIAVWIWFLGGVSALLVALGDTDPSIAAWKGSLWRAADLEATGQVVREFPDYAGPRVWLATQCVLLAMLATFVVWVYLAYRAVTATHGVGVGPRLVLLCLFVAVEVLAPVLLLAS